MKHLGLLGAATAALLIGAGAALVGTTPTEAKVEPTFQVMNPMIGGQAMLASRDFLDNARNSPIHTKLVAELKRTELGRVLSQDGDYTVFAPTDAAFAVAGNALPSDRAGLTRAMSYLVVKGKLDSQTLLRLINENGGQVKLTTLEGGSLVAQMNGPTHIVLIDGKGQMANIAIYDVYQANGVMQVIDKVVAPG